MQIGLRLPEPFPLVRIALIVALIVLVAGSGLGQCPKPGLITFKARIGPTSSAPVAVPDVNGDGKPDLVVYEFPGKTKISLGLGGGDFATPTTYVTGDTGFTPIFGDLNGDGKPEMLITSGGGGVWMNNGSGSFTYASSLAVTGAIQALADLNADGKGDLITFATRSNFSVLLGNGAGGFGSAVAYNPASPPYYLEGAIVGDYNGDGKLDVVANSVNLGTGVAFVKLVLYLNDGSGTMVLSSNDNVGSVELKSAGDLNGDGKDELFGFVRNTNAVTILLNSGAGVFTPHSYSVNQIPVSTSVSDFDGDGKKDVLVSYGRVSLGYLGKTILFGDGAGGVASQSLVTKPSFGSLAADFNNDGRTDYLDTGFNAWTDENNYYIRETTCSAKGDPRRIDYDGDGITEFTLFRPSNGSWYRIGYPFTSPAVLSQFGAVGDVPAAGDYDGDGKTDLAVFRPSDGTWYVLRSSNQTMLGFPFGLNGDKPVPGDYDGDGRTDVALYRPSAGVWYLLQSSNNSVRGIGFGTSSDIPVPADFDGDLTTDIAVFRPAEGNWYLIKSATNSFVAQAWGSAGDQPVAADYDGDGRSDIAVFRPSNGFWYALRSYDSAMMSMQWGAAGDIPVPGFVGGQYNLGSPVAAVPTVYRPSDAFYYCFDGAYINMGAPGDVPVSGPYVVQ